ncbi:TPA: phosphoglycerate dehydrogenase, partial [Stenotrophomonas maltophilia]
MGASIWHSGQPLSHWPCRPMSPKKTSFPKQDIRVLLLEGVSQTAVEVFSAAGYSQIEAHTKALPEDELKAR